MSNKNSNVNDNDDDYSSDNIYVYEKIELNFVIKPDILWKYSLSANSMIILFLVLQ